MRNDTEYGSIAAIRAIGLELPGAGLDIDRPANLVALWRRG